MDRLPDTTLVIIAMMYSNCPCNIVLCSVSKNWLRVLKAAYRGTIMTRVCDVCDRWELRSMARASPLIYRDDFEKQLAYWIGKGHVPLDAIEELAMPYVGEICAFACHNNRVDVMEAVYSSCHSMAVEDDLFVRMARDKQYAHDLTMVCRNGEWHDSSAHNIMRMEAAADAMVTMRVPLMPSETSSIFYVNDNPLFVVHNDDVRYEFEKMDNIANVLRSQQCAILASLVTSLAVQGYMEDNKTIVPWCMVHWDLQHAGSPPKASRLVGRQYGMSASDIASIRKVKGLHY